MMETGDGPAEEAKRGDDGHWPDATISAHALQQLVFAPLDFIVEDLLPPGLTILAGLPKVGKSWLILDIAASVARGVGCLGDRSCPKGEVLYLALEDNFRRLQSRLTSLLGPDVTWPSNLFFRTDWPRSDAGGIDKLRTWLEQAEAPRCVIIDIFERFRRGASRKGSGYQQDYRDLEPLQELARVHGIAIVIVHHLRKSIPATDSIEQVSGSIGMTGSADTIVMLSRSRNGTGMHLHAQGRDIESLDYQVAFDLASTRWRILDEASAPDLPPERDRTIALLKERGVAMSPPEIAVALGERIGTIRTRLSRMVHRGQLWKVGPASYAIDEPERLPVPMNDVPGVTPVTDVTGVTPVTLTQLPDASDAAPKVARSQRSNSRRKLITLSQHPTAMDEMRSFRAPRKKKT